MDFPKSDKSPNEQDELRRLQPTPTTARTDQIIYDHLAEKQSIGVYPLMNDDWPESAPVGILGG
ncbi:MAG TPA: hypothetical protein DHU56_10445 [Marinobacter sp.]|jgi:hypothetical protein|nr:hypothetical protein [Marinobacter sp.]